MKLKTEIFSYTSVNILSAAVPFLLLPILTSYLLPEDYGLLALIQLLMVLSWPIIMMNTHGLLTIEYSSLGWAEFQKLFSTIIWVPVFGFSLLELLFYVFEDYINQYFHLPANYIFLIPLFVLLQTIPAAVLILFQAKKNPLNFGKYKIVMTVLNLALSLIFVVVLRFGWEGRIFGIVGSFFVFTIIGGVILFKLNYLRFLIDKKSLHNALHFGLPLIPHSIAGTFLAMSDRLFLANMVGDSAVGVYSVAFQMASMVLIVMSSINQAWAPNLFECLNNKPTTAEKINVVKQTYIIMAGMCFITLGFIIVSPYLFDLLINERYEKAQKLAPVIAIAFLFQGFYFMVTNYILYSKKTKVLSFITITSAILIVILNYYFISNYGAIGCAYAMLIVWILQFLAVFFASKRIYPMPWSLRC